MKSRVFKGSLLLIIDKGFENLMGFVLIEFDGLFFALAILFIQRKLFDSLFIRFTEVNFGIEVKPLVFFLKGY